MAEGTVTLAQLRRDICTELQMPFFRRYNGPLTADGSTSTIKLVDSDLNQTDDFWAGAWAYRIASQDSSLITTFLANENAAMLEKSIASLTSGDSYEIHSIWNAYDIHRAINRAINMDGRAFPETVLDETVILEEDKLGYTISGLAKKPWIMAKVWLERNTNVQRGSPSSATASSITVAGQDFSQVTSAWKISIYAGTGSGQLHSVSSAAGAVINVTPNWTVTPDTTSKYALWNPNEQIYDGYRVASLRFDAKEFPDIVYFRTRYPSLYGMRIRFEYISVPASMTAELDTTVVPNEYVIARACSILHGQAIGDNRYNRDMHYAEHIRYKERADEILARFHPHVPDITIWTDFESPYHDMEDPLGWRDSGLGRYG